VRLFYFIFKKLSIVLDLSEFLGEEIGRRDAAKEISKINQIPTNRFAAMQLSSRVAVISL
jgi:hypothetical protein